MVLGERDLLGVDFIRLIYMPQGGINSDFDIYTSLP